MIISGDHKLGQFRFDYDAGRGGGFHINILVPKPNRQWGYVTERMLFAVWWARGCDAGISLWRFEFRLRLGRREPQ